MPEMNKTARPQKQSSNTKEADHFLHVDHSTILALKGAAVEMIATAKKMQKACSTPPNTIAIRPETYQQLASNAQWLKLRDADALAEIVLQAFNDMVEEEGWITFPLALTQVETVG